MILEQYLPKEILDTILYRYLPFKEVLKFQNANVLDRLQIFIDITRIPKRDELITYYICMDNECLTKLSTSKLGGDIKRTFWLDYPDRRYFLHIEIKLEELYVCSIISELRYNDEQGILLDHGIVSNRTYVPIDIDDSSVLAEIEFNKECYLIYQ